MIELLQEIREALMGIGINIYYIDSFKDEERIILNYIPMSGATDDHLSNDLIYVSLVTNKLSDNGKSIHDIARIDSLSKNMTKRIATHQATNKLYNITYLGKPQIFNEENTDKSKTIMRFQVTTKTNLN